MNLKGVLDAYNMSYDQKIAWQRVEDILMSSNTITELLDILQELENKIYEPTDDKLEYLIMERVEKLSRVLNPKIPLHILSRIADAMDERWDDKYNPVKNMAEAWVCEEDNYLDLVQAHHYLSPGEWRDRVEARLAELNHNLLSLYNRELEYRLSITPLGCKAREMLESAFH